jgi:glyoxylate carboligase
MKGSELLVAALENEGVERIFGVPGEENLDVVEALRRSRINLVVTRHERAAAFMAATHGRLTGKPGVCLSPLGPGALNLTTGAAYALLGAMPMVMITGQKGILSRKQARFQVADIVVTSFMDGSCPVALSTTQLWHTDAVRGPSTPSGPGNPSVRRPGKAPPHRFIGMPARTPRTSRG